MGTRLAGLGLRVRRLVGRLVAGRDRADRATGGIGSRYGARTLLVACRGLVTLVGGGLVTVAGGLGGSVARIRGGLVSVSNSLRGIGSLVGFLGRYSLISGLRDTRFSLVGICGGRLVVHAQGAVEVVQRERDGAEVHVAVRRVIGLGALGHGSSRIVGGHLEGELVLDGGRVKPRCRLQRLHAGQAHLHRIARGVRVLELQAIAQVRRCRKRAVAVIDDRHREWDRLRLRRDALASQAVGLLVSQVAHRPRDDSLVGGPVGVAVLHQALKHLGGVVKAVERHGAIGRILGRPQVVPARCVLHREGELAGGKRTSRERLGRRHLSGRTARVIGRGGILVGEGNHRRARAGSRRICAVHVRLVAIRPTGHHGLDRQCGLFRVVLDRHRYRVLRRVVGVAVGRYLDLDHLIGVRLAHVALTQHHVLLAQRGLHGLHTIGSCGHGNLGAFQRQAQRVRRRLVARSHLDGELALGHIAAGQGLGHVQAARRRVIDLGSVAIHEPGVLRDCRGLERAGAVVGHRHLDGGHVAVVLDARQLMAVGGHDLTHLVGERALMVGFGLHHVGRERDGPEPEALRVRLGHRRAGHIVARGILGQRTAIERLQLERELVGIDPIAALEHLVQAGGGGVIAGRGCLIAVHERHGRGIDDLPIQLDGQRQMLVGIAAHTHRDLERMYAVVVGDAGFSLGVGRHDLAHFVCERLADVGLRERDAVHLRHIARDAIGTRSVGEAAVGSRQASFSLGSGNRAVLVNAMDAEGELISCHVAAFQRLLDGDAGELRLLLVLVLELRRPVVVFHHGDQLALMAIGHRDRNLVHMAIEHDAAGYDARCIKIVAAVLILLHRERIRAGLAERHLAEGEPSLIARLRAAHHGFVGALRDDDVAGFDGLLRGIIRRAQLEAERLAFRHIAASQHLGAVNRRIALELSGIGLVRVIEAEHGAGNRLFAIVFVVLGAQFKLAANIRDGHLRGPNRRVIHHAGRVEGLVLQDISHGTPRIADLDRLDDLVLEGRLVLPGRNIVKRERCLRERDAAACLDRGQSAIPHLAAPLMIDARHAFALGQRCLVVVRASYDVEHVRLKRVLTRRIRIRLRAAGSPLHHIGIVLVHEPRRIVLDKLRLLISHAIIVCQLRHHRLHRQHAVVALVRYRHDDLVQRLRCAHAGPQLTKLLGFPNLVRVCARLRIGDALEMEAHRNAILGIFARYRNARLALAAAQGVSRRHRRLNGRIGILHDEHERIGEPIATGQHLLALEVRLAIQRAGCGIRVLVRYRARLAGSDLALSTGGLCREAGARRLAYLIVPACGKPVHVQGLARLQGMLRLAVLAERQHELIALLLAVRVLHHGVEALADGILHGDGELEGFVREISRVVPFGQLQLLRHRQRAGHIDAQLAVIAQISVDERLRGGLLNAAPLRVQNIRGRDRAVLFLDLVQFVDIGQTRRAGLEIAGARVIPSDSAFDLLSGIAGEGHMLGLRDGLAAFHGVIVVLVVVRGALLYRLRGNSACFIGIDGRVLREVIVAIARSRLERGNRVARFVTGPLVGIEVHFARCVGVLLHIRLHGVIGILQQIERRRLHAGGIQHRDRRGVRNAHGILRQVDGEVAQRDQGCGHLHLHLVAHRNIVRTRDGDHDVFQVGIGQTGMHTTAEMVRVDVSIRGLGLAAVHRSVVHELGQVGDLHVIAQLIVKGDVAGTAFVAISRLRRIAGALDDLLGDVVEHAL